jgi:hypothetical protein
MILWFSKVIVNTFLCQDINWLIIKFWKPSQLCRNSALINIVRKLLYQLRDLKPSLTKYKRDLIMY